MSSAICFILDQSKILLSGNGLSGFQFKPVPESSHRTLADIGTTKMLS